MLDELTCVENAGLEDRAAEQLVPDRQGEAQVDVGIGEVVLESDGEAAGGLGLLVPPLPDQGEA